MLLTLLFVGTSNSVLAQVYKQDKQEFYAKLYWGSNGTQALSSHAWTNNSGDRWNLYSAGRYKDSQQGEEFIKLANSTIDEDTPYFEVDLGTGGTNKGNNDEFVHQLLGFNLSKSSNTLSGNLVAYSVGYYDLLNYASDKGFTNSGFAYRSSANDRWGNKSGWQGWFRIMPNASVALYGVSSLFVSGGWDWRDTSYGDGMWCGFSSNGYDDYRCYYRYVTAKSKYTYPAPVFTWASPTSVKVEVSNVPRVQGKRPVANANLGGYNSSTETGYRSVGYAFGSSSSDYSWTGLKLQTSSSGNAIIRSNVNAASAINISYVPYSYDTFTFSNPSRSFESVLPGTAKSTTLKACPCPSNVVATADMWNKKVVLTWDANTDDKYTNGKWYIFRYQTSKGVTNRTNIATLALDKTEYVDADSKLEFDTDYTYEVAFVGNGWESKYQVPNSGLYASCVGNIVRSFPMSISGKGNDNNIVVTVNYPESAASITYEVWRKPTTSGSFSKIYTVTKSTYDAGTFTYTDENVNNSCTAYQYEVHATVQGKSFIYGNNQTYTISGKTNITKFTVSKGSYTGLVSLQWDVDQKGEDNSKFLIYRRLLGSSDKFSKIYVSEGKLSSYQYQDQTALPGQYYEYKIEAYSKCDDSYVITNSKVDNGFCQNTGVISGRVTYGTGVAVPDAKVYLTQGADDAGAKAQYYTANIASGSGIKWSPSIADHDSIFGSKKAYSVEMWIRPNAKLEGTSTFMAPTNAVSLQLTKKADGSYNVVFNGPKTTKGADYTNKATTLNISKSSFTHLTLSTDGSGVYKVRRFTVDSKGNEKLTTWTSDVLVTENANAKSDSISVFGNSIDVKSSFEGYIDEIRVWNKELTDAEIKKFSTKLLAGTEQGLAIYWPLDEGIKGQKYAYDYSRTGGICNENHGTVLNNVTFTQKVVPAQYQLGLYGITDTQGNYTIRGVPFGGEGTTYTVRPTLGVHEFSPQYKSTFVNSSSLNHSGLDFSDMSSFDVKGYVYYKNTNIPVEGVNFYVDGVVCSKNSMPVTSDENGEYTISVPIGEHYITAYKNGHVFVNNGRYPSDPKNVGTTFAFEKEVSNLTFYDSTLVNIAGRVVGGDIEFDKPLGFGESKNNIGTAEITLAIENKSLNMKVLQTDTKFEIVNGDEDYVLAPTASSAINSTTKLTKCESEQDLTGEIVITTDPETGEFSAMLPPLEYKVKSVTIPSNSGLKLGEYANVITATNVNNIKTDSITVDGTTKTFDYTTSFMLKYTSDPIFKVTDTTQGYEGKYGLDKVAITLADGTKETVQLINPSTKKYNYSLPMYQQYETYKYKLKVYEEYTNREKSPAETTQVPLSGIEITASNALGAQVQVVGKGATVTNEDGEKVTYKAGDAYDVEDETVTLDENGEGEYKWTAGLPNITSPYTRGISFYYNKDGKQYDWMPDGLNAGLQAVILGDLPSGTNILTAGPDRVLYVLRDPPGTGSSATWTTGSSTSFTESYSASVKNNDVLNSDISIGAKTTTIQGTIGAMTIFAGQVLEADNMQHIKINTEIEAEAGGGAKKSRTVTTTSDISTSDSYDFVGAAGDVFVGASTNVSYGNARRVTLQKNASTGKWKLGVKDQLTMGTEFNTEFTYEQNYIEGTLIPNFEMARNALFDNGITCKSRAEAEKYVNNSDHNIYLTWLDKDDERYGSSNNDADVWGETEAAKASGKYIGMSYACVLPKKRKAGEAYQDKVQYYNEQIRNWTKILADNEEAKVKAKNDRKTYLKKNFSFSAGASRTETYEEEKSSGWTAKQSFSTTISAGSETDINTSFGGVNLEYSLGVTAANENEWEGEDTHTETVTYTLAEDGDDDMISVDVYKAPDDFGPIFITRGGQTCAPYEGATYTKYYTPVTQLNEATMQIEVPKLTVGNEEKQQLLSGVAIGKKANFTLHCKNESETGEDCYFYLIPLQETISGGAILSTSQGPIGTGKFEVFVPAGSTTDVVVSLAQNDQSILNYDKIGLRLASTSQYDPTGVHEVIDDTVYISAHFVAGSTDVSIKADKSVMNIGTGTDYNVTVRDYDINWKNLKAIRIQYRGERDTEWSNAKIYVPAKKVVAGQNEAIPTTGIINFTLDMSNLSTFPDQTYQFRAQSATSNGATSEVTFESDPVTLIKDVTAPALFGAPRPTNGVLGASDEISITYNEDIKKNILTKVDNFVITGILNEDEVKHDVALKLENTTEAAAATEATYNMAGKSWSTDMWINVSSAGTIFSHGNGSNKLTLSVNSSKKLVVKIGETSYTASKTIPYNKWVYLAFSYVYKEGASSINAMTAYDATTEQLFTSKRVVDYDGNGRITVGEKITGAIQELSLWSKARTMVEAQSTMYQTKKPSTANLIGYWKFNEGKEAAAADLSRNRNMVLSKGNWYLNNTNYALALTGKNYVNLNTAECPIRDTEDYAYEMWFKGSSKNAGKTLFSVGAKTLSVSFDANGLMNLNSGSFTQQVGTASYLDGAWHHFALNLLRNGSAIVYIDGTSAAQTSASNVNALASDKITLGAQRYFDANGQNAYKNYFTGSIDEVRVWNATLTASSLREARMQRLDGSEDGLVAYYPFEYQHLDAYNQVVTDLTLSDRVKIDAAEDATSNVAASKAADAPALKPNITETNLNFSFVANERGIILNLDEDADRLDGTTVHFTVKSVSDENGNIAKPIRWSAFIKQNVLAWLDDEAQMDIEVGKEAKFSATITNNSGSTQDWSLSSLPSWLSADATAGSVNALGKATVNFTVSSATQIGKYEEVIYVTDNSGINMPLTLSVNVQGEKPLWAVDVNKFDNYKPMVGVVKINNIPSEDNSDIIAAFIDGECRGVASPVYEKEYDTYFVNMRVYGNSGDDYNKNVTFKVWDASQNKTFAHVTTSPAATVTFDADAVSGSYKSPFVWNTDTQIEQVQDVKKGWNWISLFVTPENMKTSSVMESVTDNASLLKSFNKFAEVQKGSWTGVLTTLSNGELYKLKMNAADSLSTYGEETNATSADNAVTINKGWNWIGVNASYNMSVNAAFAGLSPQNGDVVKGQYGFATYDSYTWRGTLQNITPGQGYLYYSNNASKTSFNYPSKAAAQVGSAQARVRMTVNDDNNYFEFDGSSYNMYPNNMIVVAKVVDGEGIVDNAEVAVFDKNGICREAQKADADGFVFLTIPGETSGEVLSVKVFDGKNETEASSLIYSNDAINGSVVAPYFIQLGTTTGIASVQNSGVKVYPTVISNEVNIDSDKTIRKVSIFDNSGRVVVSLTDGISDHNVVSTASLAKGVYYVVVDVEGGNAAVINVLKK